MDGSPSQCWTQHRDPDLFRACRVQMPGGSLWWLTPPQVSNLAGQSLVVLRIGGTIDPGRRELILRTYRRGVWTLLTGPVAGNA